MKQRYFLIFSTFAFFSLTYGMDPKEKSPLDLIKSSEVESIINVLKDLLVSREKSNVALTTTEENTLRFPSYNQEGKIGVEITKRSLNRKNSDSIELVISINKSIKKLPELTREQDNEDNSDD